MDNFLKKISEEKIDESTHLEFIKYSKGVFNNKYLIEAKKNKDKWSIKTSSEFANFLVRFGLSRNSGKVNIKGVVVSTLNLENEWGIEIKNVKQFMGIKQYSIECEIESSKIIEIMDRFPKVFFALSFSLPDYELKIKAKAPRSPKPSSNGEKEAKADFCTLKTSNREIVNNLFFDFPNFDEIKIKHSLIINEIKIPEGEKDPAKIRENAIRKGLIKRFVEVDGVKKEKEYKFEA